MSVEQLVSVKQLVSVEDAPSACFAHYGGKQISSKAAGLRLLEQLQGDG